MIIGKEDQARVKFLEKTVNDLKHTLDGYHQSIDRIKEYEEGEKELLTILKAIISKFDTQQNIL